MNVPSMKSPGVVMVFLTRISIRILLLLESKANNVIQMIHPEHDGDLVVVMQHRVFL